MNKYKRIFQLIVVLLIVNFGMTVFVLLRRPPHPHHTNPKSRIIQQLNLDRQQIQQFEKIIREHRSHIVPLETKITAAKKKLMQTLIIETPQEQVDSLAHEIGAVQVEIERYHLAHFEAIRALCKPTQQQKFKKLVDELDSIFGPKKPPHNK